jgi:8-oxo-dGTP diphosphatase
VNAAAGVLYVNSDGDPLLLMPTYKKHWDLPGGIVDCGESPKAAAIREVREELGLEVIVGRLLVVDYLPAARRRPEMVAYIFDGGHIDTAKIVVDGVEIVDWDWTTAAAQVHRLHTAPILARRIQAALAARQDSECCYYLENGYA